MTLNSPMGLALDDFFRDASDMIIPKRIYLFEFPENKNVRDCCKNNDYEVKEDDNKKNKITHKCEKCGNVHLMWEEYNEKTNITTWHVKNITERYNKC